MKEEEQELQFAKEIQRIILDRIHERKRKVHKLHNIVYNDNLWLQIQTLWSGFYLKYDHYKEGGRHQHLLFIRSQLLAAAR
jgi:hypothetical protein